MEREILTSKRKALSINLDPTVFGSFAEIGAGQEVSRWFFRAGGASGTVAKTISAYDKEFSDHIYSKKGDSRYVSESRLTMMLQKEWNELTEVLSKSRGSNTRFFVFANTVTTLNYRKDNEGHGWLGVRFQLRPESEPNNVVLHARFLENDGLLQQNTLGELGVNLIFACFYFYNRPNVFLQSLLDNLSNDRVEINMIRMSGPELNYVDNRLLSVQLVKNNMTPVAMFDRKGNVQQPSDILYKKDVMVLRGSFRPITYVGFDMLKSGMSLFKKEVGFDKSKTVVLCEMTLNNLLQEGDLDERDFLARADILCGMGQNVMISNFREFYKLVSYFSHFKLHNLRMIVSVVSLQHILNPQYYASLKGGILEAFGKLFTENTALYVYPSLNPQTGKTVRLKDLNFEDNLQYLIKHLLQNQKLLDIPGAKTNILHIFSHNVLKAIQDGNPEWEKYVPVYVANCIKTKKLFGYDESKFL